MTDERLHEFQLVLKAVASFPRPRLDYSSLPVSDFLNVSYYCRLLIHQVAYMILLRTLATAYEHVPMPDALMRPGGLSDAEIIQWSAGLTDTSLSQLYCAYPDWRLFAVMADLRMEAACLDNELARRLEDKPLERELILLDWGGEDRRKAIARQLGLDRPFTHVRNPQGRSILKSRPDGETQEDDFQSAVLKMLEDWRRPGRIRKDSRPLPPLPFPAEYLLPDERAFWEGSLAKAWHMGREAIRREAVPILTGKRQSMGRRARNLVINAWDTTQRRQTKLVPQREDTTGGISAPFRLPEELLQSQTLRRRLYRAMGERYGEKGRRYLDGYLMGKNKTDASAYAGVSRETGRKYWKTLLEIGFENNPAE